MVVYKIYKIIVFKHLNSIHGIFTFLKFFIISMEFCIIKKIKFMFEFMNLSVVIRKLNLIEDYQDT